MKRSLILAALSCAVFAVAACYDRVAHFATGVVASTYRLVASFAQNMVKTLAWPELASTPPALRIVQARSYAGILMRRERPVVTSSWRMCPSI